MYAKEFLTKKNLSGSSKSVSSSNSFSEINKGILVCSTIGAGIAVYKAWTRKKNLVTSGFVGIICGTLFAKIIENKIK